MTPFYQDPGQRSIKESVMWYVIIGGIIIWVIYRYNKKKQSRSAQIVSMNVGNSGWEELKKKKANWTLGSE